MKKFVPFFGLVFLLSVSQSCRALDLLIPPEIRNKTFQISFDQASNGMAPDGRCYQFTLRFTDYDVIVEGINPDILEGDQQKGEATIVSEYPTCTNLESVKSTFSKLREFAVLSDSQRTFLKSGEDFLGIPVKNITGTASEGIYDLAFVYDKDGVTNFRGISIFLENPRVLFLSATSKKSGARDFSAKLASIRRDVTAYNNLIISSVEK